MSTIQKELPWVQFMRDHNGLREIPGSKHNPTILQWLKEMGSFSKEAKAWYADDEVPWCGLAVGIAMGKTGRYVVKEWFRAKSWMDANLTKLDKPAYGCIVVFTRQGGGHVGIVVGKDAAGNLMVFGGNQGNALNIRPFALSRVTGYYWPSIWNKETHSVVKSAPAATRYQLPILKSDGRLSTNEA